MRLVLAAMMVLAALPAWADVDSAIKAVKAQKPVIDAVRDDGGTLWVTAQPTNAINWNNYAGAVCKLVIPHQARIFVVKMVDVGSVRSRRTGDWKVMGGARCG